MIEADDGYTGEHSRGVVELALDVGRQLGLSEEQTRSLEFGALLHDVGKVAIPRRSSTSRASSTRTSGG